MKEDRIWLLVGLKLSGEASAGELTELHDLLAENPDLALLAEEVELAWKTKSDRTVPSVEDAFNSHMQKFADHFTVPVLLQEEADTGTQAIQKKSSVTKRLGWISSAAAAILAFVLLYTYNTKQRIPAPVAANIVTTKPGSKSKINLPDGTLVWLNADSRMTYYKNYGASTREVELAGEAYFDVVKDKSRPFIIHTKSMNVKVLGTAFNVRSYLNEKTSETSLIRGSVEVTMNDNPGKRIILKPNQKLVVQNGRSALPGKQQDVASGEVPFVKLSTLHYEKGDSSSIETYWIKNKLAFEDETLENVAKKIERWYDVKITITSDSLKAETYHSVFEDESLPEVMKALQIAGNFNYTIHKKEIVIRP